MNTRMTGGALRTCPAAKADLTRSIATSNHVKVVAVFTARSGTLDALLTLLDSMVAPSKAEPGNLRYDLWRDQFDPDRLVLDELYRDAEAVAAHQATTHYQRYLAAIGALAERTAFVLDPVTVV